MLTNSLTIGYYYYVVLHIYYPMSRLSFG